MVTAPRPADRLTDKASVPDDERVRDWIGADAFARWTALRAWIAQTYPGIFNPDWIYGGKKHGWALRYKKSRAFCTLLPEYGSFSAVIVLGEAEREKFEAQRSSFSARLSRLFDETETFRDGKWLKVDILSAEDLRDITALLALKRPRKGIVSQPANAAPPPPAGEGSKTLS